MAAVIPAHNERRRIGAAVAAALRALDALPSPVDACLTVVLHCCHDDSSARLRQVLRRHRGRTRVEVLDLDEPAPIARVRNLGLRRALDHLPPTPPEQIWLLSTDADSRVPPDWARAHVELADGGHDLIAGLVELDAQHLLPRRVRTRYAELVDRGLHPSTHDHVYAANLGVRADAWLAAGGFPHVPMGEEHALLAVLRAQGRPVTSSTTIRVRTSARMHGRARGGLADLLRELR